MEWKKIKCFARTPSISDELGALKSALKLPIGVFATDLFDLQKSKYLVTKGSSVSFKLQLICSILDSFDDNRPSVDLYLIFEK